MEAQDENPTPNRRRNTYATEETPDQYFDYPFDEDRYNDPDQYQMRQDLQDEQQPEKAKKEKYRKRAEWFSSYYEYAQKPAHAREQTRKAYYEYKELQRQPSKQNKQKMNKLKSKLPTPLSYEEYIFSKKQEWEYRFIDKESKKNQFELDIQGIKVVFPKDPYPQQKQYIAQVLKSLNKKLNAFIESPTGTGKTLCMLTSTLAWVHHRKMTLNENNRVLYISRTHSQLDQVAKELRETCYRPTMAIMGSREKFCINKKGEGLKNNKLRQFCSDSIGANYKLLKIDKDDLTVDPESLKELECASCPFYADRYETGLIGDSYFYKTWSNAEIKKKGETLHFCPYYYPLYMQDHCDLILMPYSYLLDIRIFQKYEKLIKNSIIIFDEAHNVGENACSGRSFQVSSQNILDMRTQFTNLQTKAFPIKGQSAKQQLDQIRRMMTPKFKQFETEISNLMGNIKQFLYGIDFFEKKDKENTQKLFYEAKETFPYTKVVGSQNVEIQLVTMISNLSSDQLLEYQQSPIARKKYIRQAVDFIQKIINLSLQIKQAFKDVEGPKYYNTQITLKMFYRISDLLRDALQDNIRLYAKQILHYCLQLKVDLGDRIINGQVQFKKYCLSLNCLVPWFTFKEIEKFEPYSILFTSGTMNPIDDWEYELGIKGEKRVIDPVITPRQIRINIVTHDLKGELFLFSKSNMTLESKQKKEKTELEKTQHRDGKYQAMLNMISSIAKQVPGGVLVVLPSYSMLKDTYGYLKQSKQKRFIAINSKIEEELQAQFFEQEGKLQEIEKYKAHIKNGNRGILYCVCRGKASEGVDFPDNECRAVIFVGVPHLNSFAPLLAEKKAHYEWLMKQQKSSELANISWNTYAFNSIIRATNQALGRVIRHKYDYGQIFLLDSRFDDYYNHDPICREVGKPKRSYKRNLPKWAQGDISSWGKYRNDIKCKLSKINQFYSRNKYEMKKIGK